MAALNAKLIALQKSAARFAKKEIAPRPDLSIQDDFPLDIWRKMADGKWLGIAIPRTFGGLGGGYHSITATGESLVENGRNLGLVLSWMIHQVVSHFFILRFGNEWQQNQYLPALARGALTACFAVSEPGVGAHPRHLKAFASFRNGRAILHGEKTFLTNGPIAGLFIVIAVTGSSDGKKEFTAFLVPREAPGLFITESLKLNILRPSPHCGILLDHCEIPETSVLGERGTAYPSMVMPFRDVEDVLLAGPAIGAMKVQLEIVISAMREIEPAPSDELKTELGGLESLLHALRAIVYEAAGILDSGKNKPVFLPLLLSFRPLARDFQARLSRLIAAAGIKEDQKLKDLTKDIASIINLANNIAVIKQKKIGEGLLSGKD
jgi:alkylation response protein AidB-like acyl-CoA dehydrogenase